MCNVVIESFERNSTRISTDAVHETAAVRHEECLSIDNCVAYPCFIYFIGC